ncbi:glycosyltransferase family 4 protein [candidate division WOR-3 bacterium]|nr:glycosyltransferase family 4 protein [candidate division WOR-3 bacterium]
MPNLNLNLLYFVPCGLHTGVGGGARLKNMIDVFEQLRVNIQLISYISKEEFKIKHERTSDFLNTTTIYIPKSLPKFLKAFAIPLIIIHGLKYIRRSDILFAHSPCVTSGFPAMILAKMFNKPLIIDHMDVKDPDTPKFIFNSMLKNSTIVFAISHYLVDETKRYGCKNVVYLPIFINTNVFQRDVLEREKIRNGLAINDKEILIGYAGSFSPVMGVPFLLEAFKNLVKRYENIKLIVIGGRNVPSSDNVPLLIDELTLKEKVILIPQQPHELIPKYLSACDIVCSPMINCEVNRAANPIKVYEYMSMSLPTVVSAVGEVSNVIENGVNGFLVKPGDIKDLEEKLEWIILNPDRSKEIGENGRKKVMEKYSYDAIRDTIKQSISEIIDMKNGDKRRNE